MGFLGLAGWYRRFIANFSVFASPITDLLRLKTKFMWTEAEKAFEELNAVLVQLNQQGEERPVAYMSKKLNSAQRNYSVRERECLVVILGIDRFMLSGIPGILSCNRSCKFSLAHEAE